MSDRNSNIDILKIVLAFLVIALHLFPVSKLEGISGLISYEIASGITRIAVPTFFIISGYFLRNKLNDKTYLLKYAKRILLLYLVWQLIYLPDLIRFYKLGWFSKTDALLKLIYGYWHLWYLLATVLAVGLLYLSRNWSLKIKWSLIVFLLIFGYSFQILIQSDVLHHELDLQFVYTLIGTTRNFLFFAFPMLLIGTLYESWKDSASKVKGLLLPFFIGLLLENYLYYTHKVKALDFLVCLIPLCMILFYWVKESAPITNIKFNATMSLGIYLCHPYAIRLVSEFLPQKTFEITVLKYFIVALLAIGMWWILEKINKKLPYFL
ncbi:acyltransferase [Flavobacterium sp.]|uniref:acyltransferase family protein n=1 Tax=Flavobacterium sp. TaxID=239 RepID=UPI00260187DA|nr:acyltransferase [Flavobacterium sp.]